MKKWRSVILACMIMAMLIPVTPYASASGYDKKEIKFSRILNARDFGGYKTKSGKRVKKNVLIRSAELSYATSKDMKKLNNKYHLKRVIDFRYRSDFKYCPDKRIKGVKYTNISASKGKGRSASKAKKRYKKIKARSNKTLRRKGIKAAKVAGKSYAYQLVMSKYSQRQYRKYFNYLLANKNADGVLIHCVHGKDRTGVAAFMTLVALGVPEKTAYYDYSLTNAWIKKYDKKAFKKYRIGVRTSELKYAVKKAKKKYGSMERFLYKAYGLSSKDLKKLRKIYTQ